MYEIAPSSDLRVVRYMVLSIWAIIASSRSTGWYRPRSSRTRSGSPGRRSIFPTRRRLANYLNVWFGAEEYAADAICDLVAEAADFACQLDVIATTSTFLAVLFGSVLAYGVSRYRILSEARMFQL